LEFSTVWGVHPIRELLNRDPARISEVVIHHLRPGPKLQEISRLARELGIKVRFDPSGKKISAVDSGVDGELRHQGITATVLPFGLVSLEEMVARSRADSRPPLLLALDSIQDPYNLGAIIRSALAAGVHGVILTKDRSAPLTGTVAKASAGAIAHMQICRVVNLVAALNYLKKEGVWIFGTAKDAPLSIYQTDFSGPACLVVGGEGKGIRPLVREQCDFLVTIPMQGGLDSLNSSVAAAVVLFEIARQRS